MKANCCLTAPHPLALAARSGSPRHLYRAPGTLRTAKPRHQREYLRRPRTCEGRHSARSSEGRSSCSRGIGNPAQAHAHAHQDGAALAGQPPDCRNCPDARSRRQGSDPGRAHFSTIRLPKPIPCFESSTISNFRRDNSSIFRTGCMNCFTLATGSLCFARVALWARLPRTEVSRQWIVERMSGTRCSGSARRSSPDTCSTHRFCCPSKDWTLRRLRCG